MAHLSSFWYLAHLDFDIVLESWNHGGVSEDDGVPWLDLGKQRPAAPANQMQICNAWTSCEAFQRTPGQTEVFLDLSCLVMASHGTRWARSKARMP